MSKLSKNTQQRIVISLTSESAGKELIDAIESATTGSGDEYALSNLSNLTGTAIPAGVNLESLSTIQSQVTGFLIKTRNQTTSVSGSVAINSGTSTGAFASGFVNVVSGSSSNAVGALSTTTITGVALLSSGSIVGGTRGSSGSAFVRSGGVAVISSADTFSGNTGIVGVIGGTVQSSFNGATVTGNSGNASLQSGGIVATVSGATAIGTSGNVLVSSGGHQSVVGATVSGNSGSVSMQSGSVTGLGTSTANTGSSTLTTGGVTNANNVGSTGTASMSTGQNAGIGNSGSVSISTGNVINPLTTSTNFSGAISAITGKSIRATSGPIIFQTGEISPFGFNNTSNVDSFTGVFSVATGAINSALNTGSTGDVLLFSGSHNGLGNTGVVTVSSGSQLGSGNSGSVNISSGSAGIGNSGDINISTGVASGTRGGITLNAPVVVANVTERFQIQTPSTGASIQMGLTSYGQLGGPYMYIIGLASDRTFEIGGQGGMNNTPGITELHGASVVSDTNGNYTSGKLVLRTKPDTGGNYSDHVSYNSGDVELFTGDAYVKGTLFPDANTGNVNIYTGTPAGAGTRGDVVINAKNIIMQANDGTVQAKQDLLVVNNPGLNYSHISNSDPNFSFAYIGGLDSPSHSSNIGGWNSIGQSGGNTNFHGSFVRGTVDGTFKASDVYLEARAAAGGAENTADNLQISSGNITIRSHDGYVKGTGANANTGNITLQTGAAQGSGTKGYILLNGSFISANSAQIKNIADGTDPQDAVSLSQLNAKTRAGSVSIPNASNTVTVTFSGDIGTSNYSVNLQIQNTVDASPLFLDKIITSQSSTGFTVKFSQNTDSANYNLQYVAQLFN